MKTEDGESRAGGGGNTYLAEPVMWTTPPGYKPHAIHVGPVLTSLTDHKAGQSRKMSLVESLFNVFVGYWVAFATQLAVFPMFGITVSVNDNILIGAIFTAVSLVRSYFLRRFFNWLHRRAP